MPVLDDAIGVGVLGTELGDDGSIRGTFEGGCVEDIFFEIYCQVCDFYERHRDHSLYVRSRYNCKEPFGSTVWHAGTVLR